jgi:hypothetical protein
MRLLKLFSLAASLVLANHAMAVCSDTLADGRINVGTYGSQFTVFGVNGFNMAPNDPMYTNNTFTGPSVLVGNIGIGPGGTFSATSGTITGNLYMWEGQGAFSMSNVSFTGSQNFGSGTHALLTGAYNDYAALSNAATTDNCGGTYNVNGTPGTLTNVNITNTNQSVILTPTATNLASNNRIVLNLSNFVMSQGTFTLAGTAATTYIINVTNQFSLNNSKILLANLDASQIYNGANPDPGYNGVVPSHVLFNITSKGQHIALNQGTEMSGILLALKDQISQSGGKVYGKSIGGQVNITSGGQAISR